MKRNQKSQPKMNVFQEAYSMLTHEEEKIHEIQQLNQQNDDLKQKKTQLFNEDDDEDLDDEASLDVDINSFDPLDLKKTPVDRMADILTRLLLKKKITSSNAFDIPMPNIREMSDFAQYASKFENWKKLATALESEAQIYGHRVDFVYNSAYKVIGNLIRSYTDHLQENSNENLEDLNRLPLKTPLIQRNSELEDKHIEKKPENLIATKYDVEFDIDPLFKKTSEKFDAAEAKALLLNNLHIDEHLRIEFSSFQDGFETKNQSNSKGNTFNYKNLIDLNIEWDFKEKQLRKKPLGDDMDRILKEMVLQLENFENYEPKKEDESDKSESLADEPEDPYFLEEEQGNANVYVEEPEENIETKKNKDLQKDLMFEQIEEKNVKMGKGDDFFEEVTEKEEVIEPLPEEVSGNAKRRNKRKFMLVDFNMKEKEDKFKVELFKMCKNERKKRRLPYDDRFNRDLFLLPIEIQYRTESLEETFLRSFVNDNFLINQENNDNIEEEKIEEDESENQENIEDFQQIKVEGGGNLIENENNLLENEEKLMTNDEKLMENEENLIGNEENVLKYETFEKNLMEKQISKENTNGKPVKIKALALHSHISMKNLKDKLMSSISYHFKAKKNEPLKFSNILENVKSKLTEIQKSLVNMQLCFLSLLHVSNEKNLILIPCPDNADDFLICQDFTPQVPFYS